MNIIGKHYAWLARAARSVMAMAGAMALYGMPTPVHAAQTFYYFVFSNPVIGGEDRYHAWYNRHLAEMTTLPGFVTAQRYVKNELPLFQPDDGQVPQYMVVYEMVSNDMAATVGDFEKRIIKQARRNPALNRATLISYVYRPFRAEVKGIAGEPQGARPGNKQRYLQLVFTAMTKGMENEFNQFYDQQHVPEAAAIPGFISVQRMRLDRPPNGSLHKLIPATRYLALYHVETADFAAVKQAAMQTKFTPSAAFDAQSTHGYTFRAMAPLVQGRHR